MRKTPHPTPRPIPAAVPTLRLDDEELDVDELDELDVEELDVGELDAEELDAEELDAEELDVEELDVEELVVEELDVKEFDVKIEEIDGGVLSSVITAVLADVYVGVPVDGRYCIVTSFSGAGPGKVSSLRPSHACHWLFTLLSLPE
jgi:hypothetical protein